MNEQRFFDPINAKDLPPSIRSVNNYLNGRVLDVEDAVNLFQNCGCGVIENFPNYGFITLTLAQRTANELAKISRYRLIRYSDVGFHPNNSHIIG